MKKTHYDKKISDIEKQCITTADYNEFTKDIVATKRKSKGLLNKSDIDRFINNAKVEILYYKSRNIYNKDWIESRTRRNNKIINI